MKNNADLALIFHEDLICPTVGLHSSHEKGLRRG